MATSERTTKGVATSVNVRALRRDLGKLNGKKQVSRLALANLLGSSPGSIENWEAKRTVPNPKYARKLQELAARAKAGTVDLKARGRPTAKSKRATPGRERRATSARKMEPQGVASLRIEGETAAVYANHVAVERGRSEVRVRFGLAVPGEKTARVVADVLVPSAVVTALSILLACKCCWGEAHLLCANGHAYCVACGKDACPACDEALVLMDAAKVSDPKFDPDKTVGGRSCPHRPTP